MFSFEFINLMRKSDKMRGLQSILSLFQNEFNKFNNTGAQILDSTLDLSDDVKIIILLSHFLRLFVCLFGA